jgi:hypothetical protein
MTSETWNPTWSALSGQTVFDSAHQQIAAVSRAAGNLDLFAIRADGHVCSAFWNQAGGWSGDWFALPGQAVFDAAHQHVAAVSCDAGNLDLFVIGSDNHVWSTFWSDKGWNPDWFQVSGQPGQVVFDATQQQITAVSRAQGNLDLFLLGSDNHAWTTTGRVG